MRFLILIAMTLALLGCRKMTLEGFSVYKIKEGKHSSAKMIRTLVSDLLEFECRFDSSAVYQTSIPQNQGDINKLYGFSECNQTHQKNSARFGWRWFNDKLEIHAYVYNHGVRSSEFIKSVEIGSVSKYRIEISGDKYLFSVDGVSVEMDRTSKCNTGLYYMLYPYFGGDETAPHDIKIYIKDGKGVR